MKKFLLILICLFSCICGFAEKKFIVDGITYSITSTENKTVSVVHGKTGNINIPKNVIYQGVNYKITKIGPSAFESMNLTTVELPSSIDTICDKAFKNSRLYRIQLPQNITYLGNSVYEDCVCSDTLQIPQSLCHIGSKCFATSLDISWIECYSVNPPEISEDSFTDNAYNSAYFFIPEGTEEVYNNTQWGKFRIIPLLVNSINNIYNGNFKVNCNNTNITISGLKDMEPVSFYSLNGMLLKKTICKGGVASYDASANQIIIAKFGNSNIKILVK